MSRDNQTQTGRRIQEDMAGAEEEGKETACASSVSIECVRSEALGGTLTLIGVHYATASDCDLHLDYYRKLVVVSPRR